MIGRAQPSVTVQIVALAGSGRAGASGRAAVRGIVSLLARTIGILVGRLVPQANQVAKSITLVSAMEATSVVTATGSQTDIDRQTTTTVIQAVRP